MFWKAYEIVKPTKLGSTHLIKYLKSIIKNSTEGLNPKLVCF